MAKEWILNSAMNRFQLNFKRNVGPTSESIRKCAPKSLEEWQEYYFYNVKSKEHIEELGKKLFIKITEVIQFEVLELTEKDCIDYMLQLVINRTFEGYSTEIQTIYGQLQNMINYPIVASSDNWDRLFNVDFFIKINEKYIGLQIKPVSTGFQLAEIEKEKSIQIASHLKFTKKFGGKVFYIYSLKVGDKKVIQNTSIVNEIKSEIIRLESIK